jgi:hypothetical protein
VRHDRTLDGEIRTTRVYESMARADAPLSHARHQFFVRQPATASRDVVSRSRSRWHHRDERQSLDRLLRSPHRCRLHRPTATRVTPLLAASDDPRAGRFEPLVAAERDRRMDSNAEERCPSQLPRRSITAGRARPMVDNIRRDRMAGRRQMEKRSAECAQTTRQHCTARPMSDTQLVRLLRWMMRWNRRSHASTRRHSS